MFWVKGKRGQMTTLMRILLVAVIAIVLFLMIRRIGNAFMP